MENRVGLADHLLEPDSGDPVRQLAANKLDSSTDAVPVVGFIIGTLLIDSFQCFLLAFSRHVSQFCLTSVRKCNKIKAVVVV